jgi:hypothetical protein
MKFLTLKRRREQEPEVTHQTEPVTAYKAAQVVFNIRTGDVQLKGRRPGDISIEWVARGLYSRRAYARCLFHPEHKPPIHRCCGFYAVETVERILPTVVRGILWQPDAVLPPYGFLVLLEVNLAGVVIQGERRIYQASFQEVTNLWFVRYCRLCANKGILTEATALRAYWDGQDVWTEVDEWYVLEPCCSAHSEVLVEKTFARTVSLSHITSKLQVEALWLPNEMLSAERFLELITPA